MALRAALFHGACGQNITLALRLQGHFPWFSRWWAATSMVEAVVFADMGTKKLGIMHQLELSGSNLNDPRQGLDRAPHVGPSGRSGSSSQGGPLSGVDGCWGAPLLKRLPVWIDP